MLTETVPGVRDEHAGGCIHLVRCGQQGLDDDVLNTAHQYSCVDTSCTQVT